jgi:hypothetical protein
LRAGAGAGASNPRGAGEDLQQAPVVLGEGARVDRPVDGRRAHAEPLGALRRGQVAAVRACAHASHFSPPPPPSPVTSSRSRSIRGAARDGLAVRGRGSRPPARIGAGSPQNGHLTGSLGGSNGPSPTTNGLGHRQKADRAHSPRAGAWRRGVEPAAPPGSASRRQGPPGVGKPQRMRSALRAVKRRPSRPPGSRLDNAARPRPSSSRRASRLGIERAGPARDAPI